MSASEQPAAADIRSEIAPTGPLRAAINVNNPLLARRDAATGAIIGLAVDLSTELATRVGVPLQVVPCEAAGKIAETAGSNVWDIAFLAFDPKRAQEIEFTGAHVELEATYLVPPESALRRIVDVDQEGIRIAATAGSAYDLFLSRALKHARLVHANSNPKSVELMLEQKLDAVAGVRTMLAGAAAKLPGWRILEGHFMTIPQSAGLPKGRVAAARFASAFIEEMKSSGFIAAALKRHGLGPDDAIVAAPAPSRL